MAVRAALVVNTGNLVTQGLYFLADRSKAAVRRKGGAGQSEPLHGKDRPVGCGNGMNQDTLLANRWMSHMRAFSGNLRGWKWDHSCWDAVSGDWTTFVLRVRMFTGQELVESQKAKGFDPHMRTP